MSKIPKNRKITRNKNIYNNTKRKKKQKTYQVIGVVLACALMVFIGYSFVEPIQKFLTGDLDRDAVDIIEKSSSEQEKIFESNISGSTSSENSESSEKIEEETKKTNLKDVKGIYVPIEVLKNIETFSVYLDDIKAKGYNLVTFNLKDEKGYVHYNSALEKVLTIGALAENPIDLNAIFSLGKEKNITLLPRIFAFKDPIAGEKLESGSVMYEGPTSGYRWLDAAGNRWLSPEQPASQQYILEIIDEVTKIGFENVIVDAIQYPEGFTQNVAYSGERSKTDKLGVLNDVILLMEETAAKNNSGVILLNTSQSLVFGDDNLYGGNPGSINISSRAITIFPTSLPKPLTIGEIAILDPALEAENTTKLMFENSMKNIINSKSNIILFLQHFSGYENGNSTVQINSIDNTAIGGYILYNDQGIY